jgi:hypothetical protein
VVDRRLRSITYTGIENLFLGGMKDKEVNKDRTKYLTGKNSLRGTESAITVIEFSHRRDI